MMKGVTKDLYCIDEEEGAGWRMKNSERRQRIENEGG